MQNNSKFKICFITFYFGKLPNYFILWLNSVRYNNNYDFILYTDDKTKYDFPNNLYVKYETFENISKKVQRIYDFKVCLPYPYKLCDFRPAFGDIFYDDIKEYDFWGTMDLDIVLGDIKAFITEELLTTYDKLLIRDHFCLYRNTDEVRKHYKGIHPIGRSVYKDVFTSKKIFSFGEASPYGVYRIWKYNNWKMFANIEILADIDVWDYDFILVGKKNIKNNVFQYEEGKLYRKYYIKNKITSTEYLYMHLQKRKMSAVKQMQSNNYLIVPNKFIFLNDNGECAKELILLYNRKNYFIHNILWKFNKIIRKLLKTINNLLYNLKCKLRAK